MYLRAKAKARADALDMFFPETPAQAILPHPIVRPLVLRARHNETVHIQFRNEIRGRRVGMHLVADGYDVKTSDGSYVGNNPTHVNGKAVNLAMTGECIEYKWVCND